MTSRKIDRLTVGHTITLTLSLKLGCSWTRVEGFSNSIMYWTYWIVAHLTVQSGYKTNSRVVVLMNVKLAAPPRTCAVQLDTNSWNWSVQALSSEVQGFTQTQTH
jgi:hypothetical protein